MRKTKINFNGEMMRLGLSAGILLGILSVFTNWSAVIMTIWILAFLAVGGHEDKLSGLACSASGQALGVALVVAIFSPYFDAAAAIGTSAWAFAAAVGTVYAIETISKFRNKNQEQIAN